MRRWFGRPDGAVADADQGIEAERKAAQEQRDAARREKMRGKRDARLERQIEAALRLRAVDPSTLPYPERLVIQRFGLYSQNEEDGILLALLGEAGATTRKFVDIGSGRSGGNSGFLARELGFSGLMVDASDTTEALEARFGSSRVSVARAFVTAETVEALLTDHALDGEIDLLSIDIDGNDLWIWNSIVSCRPRIAVIEYNASWGRERALTIPYEPEFARSKQRPELLGSFFGASLAALVLIGRERGYRLVCTDPEGVNAFFLRDDVAGHVPELGLDTAFANSHRNERLRQREFDLVTTLDALGQPYVDLEDALPGPGETLTAGRPIVERA